MDFNLALKKLVDHSESRAKRVPGRKLSILIGSLSPDFVGNYRLSINEKISIRGVLERYRVPMDYALLQTKKNAVDVLYKITPAPACEYWRYTRDNMPRYFKGGFQKI